MGSDCSCSEERPAQVPIGFYWRYLMGERHDMRRRWVFSRWQYVTSRDKIPTDRSGIQVKTVWEYADG